MAEAPRPSLASVRREIAFHQQELSRLQALVDANDRLPAQTEPSTTPPSLSSPTYPPHPHPPPESPPLRPPSISVDLRPSPSITRFLDEDWAKRAAQQSLTVLPWMQEWSRPFARPPVSASDPQRSVLTAQYMAAAEPIEELLTRLCQLARAIFRVKWAAVALVEENFVHLRAADTVHPPLMGHKFVPRLISLCNW